MNLTLALLLIALVVLAVGFRRIPELMKGVKQGLDDFGGGGPRLRF